MICNCESAAGFTVMGMLPRACPLTVATVADTLNVPATVVSVIVVHACVLGPLVTVVTGLVVNVDALPPGRWKVTGTPATGALFTLTTAQTLLDVAPAVPEAEAGDPATTVVPAGNCTDAV